MKFMMLTLGAALSLWMLPTNLQAQVPVVLICQDGSSQPGSSKVACGDHGGMDWEATRKWTEMRAGQFAVADTVVCTDGQARAAGPSACAGHGGVDSVSTLAAVKRRAKAQRFAERSSERTTSEGATVAEGTSANTAGKAKPETREDSLKWGYPETRDPEVQNPPGYRGMERAIETFPADSAPPADTEMPLDPTSRVGQMTEPDSMQASDDQNPAGYRGMERPAGLDSLPSSIDSVGAAVESIGADADSMAAETSVKSETSVESESSVESETETTHAKKHDKMDGKPTAASEKDSTECKCE